MKSYSLPSHIKRRIKRPWGILIPHAQITKKILSDNLAGAELIVAVGDATTDTLYSKGIQPDIYIVDGRERRSKRRPTEASFKIELRATNPAGTISEDALDVLKKAVQLDKPIRILIDGEEDLLVLPVIVYYPTGTVVLYGQPEEGLVVSRIDRFRSEAKEILHEIGVF